MKSKGNQSVALPITKRNRPWKEPRTTPSSAMKNVGGLKLSWEKKKLLREERQALLITVRAAREEDKAAKDAERKRRYEKRKLKEENEMRSAKKVMITNPKKLNKMSKKQFLAAVHKK
jgi:Cgr1 family